MTAKREPAVGELVRFVRGGASVLDHGPGRIRLLAGNVAKVAVLTGGPIVGGVTVKKGQEFYFARCSLEATVDGARFVCHCSSCEKQPTEKEAP